jgi:hypothetical protein
LLYLQPDTKMRALFTHKGLIEVIKERCPVGTPSEPEWPKGTVCPMGTPSELNLNDV